MRAGPTFDVKSIEKLGELLSPAISAKSQTSRIKVKTDVSGSQSMSSSLPVKRNRAEAGISLLPAASKLKTLPQTPNPPVSMSPVPPGPDQ